MVPWNLSVSPFPPLVILEREFFNFDHCDLGVLEPPLSFSFGKDLFVLECWWKGGMRSLFRSFWVSVNFSWQSLEISSTNTAVLFFSKNMSLRPKNWLNFHEEIKLKKKKNYFTVLKDGLGVNSSQAQAALTLSLWFSLISSLSWESLRSSFSFKTFSNPSERLYCPNREWYLLFCSKLSLSLFSILYR